MNIKEKASMISSVKELLYGVYKPHEYEKVILPMTIIKRFNDCLLSGKEYKFSNSSLFTFEELLKDKENIERNFKTYLMGFSENVTNILNNFKFNEQIKTLADNNLLYHIIHEFNSEKGYLGDDKITAIDMGYIFEELIKQFTENHSDKIGAHFTSRDIVYLMTDLLLEGKKEEMIEGDKKISAYDMTMGTSQMLSCMEERLRDINESIKLEYYGQELNPYTASIAQADALIKGRDSENMKQGNTLSDDKFKDYTFDYIISNPPYGVNWKTIQKEIEVEHALGEEGRFVTKLPSVDDGQMLFMLNGIKKLKNNGKMAILHNGSPLFTGNAGSGASEIRRYIIENDWLEAIVQLSDDAFYNTPITTYIWLINKNKPQYRKGKVQLIDASKCFEKRRKNIGDKKKDITDACRELIVKAYSEFENKMYALENEISCESKIFDNIEFGYSRITIETPLLDEEGNVVRKGKKNKIVPDTKKRDYEDVPLDMDIDAYFEKEVKPYNDLAWIDKNKTKIGYEIPFTRYFYKYTAPEKSDDIAKRIYTLETEIVDSINALFAEVGE